MTQFYRHSGTAPLLGIVRATIIGTGAATFLAIIYAYAIHYIPFVYLNLLMTLGMGFVVGIVVSHEAKGGKIRHGLIPALIGLFAGLAGLYVAWGADLIARVGIPENRGVFAGLDPRILMNYVAWFYENGLWGVGRGGGVVSGKPLAAVWLIEAGMIVGLAVLVPWTEFQSNAFCESCDIWTTPENDVVRLQDVASDEIKERLLAGDFGALDEIPRAADGAMQFVRLKLSCCDNCESTNALGMERVTITLDKEKKPSEKTVTLFDRLLISSDEVELIRNAGKPAEAEHSPSTQDAAANEQDQDEPEANEEDPVPAR
jgi:hypothetical protein